MKDARKSVRFAFKNVIAASVYVLAVLLGAAPAAAHPEILVQIEEVTAQIAADPTSAELYRKRGDLYRDHEDWSSAVADFDRARRIDPELRDLDFSVGRMWVEAGRAKEALPFLNRFLSKAPDHAEGLTFRGRAHADLGQPLAAAADFGHAIELGVGSGNLPPPELFLWRARAQMAAGGKHQKDALAGLEQGVRLLGGPITLEIEALAVELALQRVESALERVERLAAASARPEPWLVRRGEILEQAGRLAESRQSYVAALGAIEALPETRRRSGSLASLEQKARAALQRMPVAKTENGGTR